MTEAKAGRLMAMVGGRVVTGIGGTSRRCSEKLKDAGVGGVGGDGLLTLVVGEGHVGLEEEHEEAVVALDGALVGLDFEVLHGVVAGLAPGLGEFGVFVAPAVDGGRDQTPAIWAACAGGCALLPWAARNLLLLAAAAFVVVAGAPAAGVLLFDGGGLTGRMFLSVQLAIHGLNSYLRTGLVGVRSGQPGCDQNRS